MIWWGLSDGLGAELLVGEWVGKTGSPQCGGIKCLGNDRAYIGFFHNFLFVLYFRGCFRSFFYFYVEVLTVLSKVTLV